MTIDDVVTEVEVEWRESQNQRDKRVEELWRKLDPQGTGELDLRGLQRGLRKIDHRQHCPPCLSPERAGLRLAALLTAEQL